MLVVVGSSPAPAINNLSRARIFPYVGIEMIEMIEIAHEFHMLDVDCVLAIFINNPVRQSE